jgi:HEAT repeat protein
MEGKMKVDLLNLEQYLVRILAPNSNEVVGTGFFCKPDGWILTCHHVINAIEPYIEKANPSVKFSLGPAPASIINRADIVKEFCIPGADIAVLRAPKQSTPYPYLPLDVYDRWRKNPIDHTVRSRGYPEGPYQKTGIGIDHSQIGTELPSKGFSLVQITASNMKNIDFGFSGAPVVDETTEKVIGLIHAKAAKGYEYQAFFVPITELMKSWNEMKEFHDPGPRIRRAIARDAEKILNETKLKGTVFIPLRLEYGKVPEPGSKQQERKDRIQEEWGFGREWSQFSLKNLCSPVESYILSSSVGTGKTVFLLQLTTAIGFSTQSDRFPLFIPCEEFEGWNAGNWKKMRSEVKEKICSILHKDPKTNYYLTESDVDYLLWKYHKDNKLVFLFDGLDQIHNVPLYKEAAKAMVKEPVIGNNRYIISSRPSGVIACQKDPKITFLRLREFSSADEKQYFGNYYDTARSICRFAPWVTKVPMLAFMVRKVIEGQRINEIRNRADLYSQFIHEITEHHDSAGQQSADLALEIRGLLAEISFRALNRDQPAIQKIPAGLIKKILKGQNIDILTKFGLVNLIEEGEKFFFFTHQSFQEYLAAKFIDDDENSALYSHVLNERWNPKWREVIKFLAGIKGDIVIRKILEPPDNIIHSNLFLAAEMMSEVKEPDMKLWEKIYDDLKLIQDPVFSEDIIRVKGYLGRCHGISEAQLKEIIKAILWSLAFPNLKFEKYFAGEALRQLADKVSTDIKNGIVKLLNHDDAMIREAAVNALGHLAEYVDPDVPDKIVSLLQDEEFFVQYTAWETLPLFIDNINSDVINHIVALLGDDIPDVRIAAVEALGLLADKIGPDIISNIITLLNNDVLPVRQSAANALGLAAEKDYKDGINVIARLLRENNTDMNRTAIHVLFGMAEKGDKDAMNLILGTLNDNDLEIRSEAVLLIKQLAGRINSDIKDQIIGFLKEDNPALLVNTITTLGEVADMGDQDVINHIKIFLGNNTPELRETALKALSKLAYQGEPDVIDRIISLLSDKEPNVQEAAVAALGQLAEIGDADAINNIVRLLTQCDENVRVEAVKALGKLTDKNDRDTIKYIVNSLGDSNADVRDAAVTSLGILLDKGYQDAVNHILSVFLNDKENVIVRYTALYIFERLYQKGIPLPA